MFTEVFEPQGGKVMVKCLTNTNIIPIYEKHMSLKELNRSFS